MKITRKISLLAGPLIAAAAMAAIPLAPAFASGPSSAQTTVSGSVSEVIGWETPPPATFSLGSLTPGHSSTPQDIPWSVASNDGNGTQVDLSIQNNGAETTGYISGPGPFTGTNAAADNATYVSAAAAGSMSLGGGGLAVTGVNYAWNIDSQQGQVPQSGSYTEYTVSANDTSTYDTAAAFYTPQSVFPDTVSATFTYTLVGN